MPHRATEPVTIDIPGGPSLTTSINLSNGFHEVICDLCGLRVTLTVNANSQRFFTHRGGKACRKKAAKRRQDDILAEAAMARVDIITTREYSGLAPSSSLGQSSGTRLSSATDSDLDMAMSHISETIDTSMVTEIASAMTVHSLEPSITPQTPMRSQSARSLSSAMMPPPPAPVIPRHTDYSQLLLHQNISRDRNIVPLTPSRPEGSTNIDDIPSSRNKTTGVPCVGSPVLWTAGSVGLTYPFQQHKSENYNMNFEPIGFTKNASGAEYIILRSYECLGNVEPDKNGKLPICVYCANVEHSENYRTLCRRISNTKPNTPHDLLSAIQLQALTKRLMTRVYELQNKVSNGQRRFKTITQKYSDIQRVIILLSTRDIPGLRRILLSAIRRGASPSMVLHLLDRAINGHLISRAEFNQRDLDISWLVKAIAGPRLLYALNKSHGLASLSTVKRYQKIPQLVASVKVPTAEEASTNIENFLNPDIKPKPVYEGCLSLPGNVAMIDGVALNEQAQWCSHCNCVIGLGREHVEHIDCQVTSLASVEAIQKALNTEKGEAGHTCYGKEATVYAVAPYARQDHYAPIPIIVSPTCKSEKGEQLAQWLEIVTDTWRTHKYGEAMNGPIWAIASDGDATFRLAKHLLCMTEEVQPDTALGKILCPLKGLNLYTGKHGLVGTCDPKHIIKRFATLLRNQNGIIISDTNITPLFTVASIAQLPKMDRESAIGLLDPSDKQNVPKATRLMDTIARIQTLPITLNPTETKSRRRLVFFAKVLNYFVSPFTKVHMSLCEQVKSLIKYAHLTAALQIMHGSHCFTGALYADSQAVVKNVIFTVARMQLINPKLLLYLILEGTDRLEGLFGDTRTSRAGANFDIKELASRLANSSLIQAAFERNPQLDRGHRRLSLKDATGVDHVNCRSWLGLVEVGSFLLLIAWYEAQRESNQELIEEFGPAGDIDFEALFSQPNHDLLRPAGEYIGIRSTPDDARSEEEPNLDFLYQTLPTESQLQSTTEQQPQNLVPNIPEVTDENIIIGHDYDSESHNAEESEVPDLEDDTENTDIPDGVSLDDYLPDHIDTVDLVSNITLQRNSQTQTRTSDSSLQASNSENPKTTFESFIIHDGKKYLKSSVVALYLSNKRSKKVTTRTLRVRGVALEDLRRGHNLLNSTELDDDDVLKAGDLVGSLIRSKAHICLGVMDIKGFRVRSEKVIQTCIKMDALDTKESAKDITALVQLIDMNFREVDSSWEWSGNYSRITVDKSLSERTTRNDFVFEVPAIMLHPLAPVISEKIIESPEDLLKSPDDRQVHTWILPDQQLQDVLRTSWQDLSPESEEILGNVTMIPSIGSEHALPYVDHTNEHCLFIKDLPAYLRPQEKLRPEAKIPCKLCGATYKLSDMRNHVGHHILHMARSLPDPFELLEDQEIGPDPCGFCGLTDQCRTQLTKKGNKTTISSTCPYHHASMRYSIAAQSSITTPCTNIPIHCSLCPPSASGTPRTIWKYNAVYHLVAEHHMGSTRFKPEDIPLELSIDMFISSREEGRMGVKREDTDRYRDQYGIPDSDIIEERKGQLQTVAHGRDATSQPLVRPRAPSSPTTSSILLHPPNRARRDG